MEILIICLIVIALLAAIFLFKKAKVKPKAVGIEMHDLEGNKMVVSHNSLSQQPIQFELLPATQQMDETKLREIKDSKVLARVNSLVPDILQVGTTAGNVIQGSGQVLYQAIIPAGEMLTQSRDMVGAVRGFYQSTEGIRGHANLVEFKNTANVVANATAAAMGVASMVVGQYYMEQINAELKEINDGITRVADFQDNEYRSKVFALVAQVQKTAHFQVDIIENEELKIRELSNLDNREQMCIELLGQANLTIDGFSKKQKLNFEQYEKELTESQKWIVYQNTLLDVLYKIADLKHAISLGSVSREICNALPNKYSNQVIETQGRLKEWHSTQVNNLGIDIDRNRRKRIKLNKFIYKLPGLVNEGYNFKKVSDETVGSITNQISVSENVIKVEKKDLFQQDVKIIAKEGKLYYLPEDSLIS